MHAISFMVRTLKSIQAFQDGLEALQTAYPTVTLKSIREYLTTASDALPPAVKTEVDRLQAIRMDAIAAEMFYLEARAKQNNITLPEDLLDGSALDPIVEPHLYEIGGNFSVLEYFSWYSPLEIAQFQPRKF